MDNLPPPPRNLDDQEESVRIAVKALGDMRKSGGRGDAMRGLPHLTTSASSSSPYSSSSTPRSPALSTTSASSTSAPSEATSTSGAFVSRMSSFPLVGSALRVYEQGKASSRVVKYGAEMVESSVKTISRPVIDRLPVNQIEEFSVRQLDRLDRFRRPSNSESPTLRSSMAVSPNPSVSQERDRRPLTTKTFDGSVVEEEEEERGDSSNHSRQWIGGERNVPRWLEANSPFVAPPPPPPEDRSATPTQNDDSRSDRSQSQNPPNQVAQRSRWQAVLLEAGGLSAALSEESMRRLKYCLQWLQYATAHIDAQILILRDFTANLQPLPSDNLANSRRPPISEEHMRKLTDVRRDIVHTIRQVVDVVSKYAGSGLPEPARARVKGLILKLPQRWANRSGTAIPVGAAAGERETVAAAGSATGALRRPGGQRRAAHRERGAGAEGLKSGPNSRAPSPSSSPRMSRAALATHARHGSESHDQVGTHVHHGHAVSPSAALVASQRILTLATESLDMMRNVTGVVKESLDRADAWVGRFRTVGLRGAQEGADVEDEEFQLPDRHRHRRTGSAQSDFNDNDGAASPFFSSSSASNWGSSIPSTPGGGTFTPVYGSYAANAPSPGAISIPIGSMSLASRYNTPKSVSTALPEDDSESSGGGGYDVSSRSLHAKPYDPKVYDRGRDVKVYNAESDIEHDERGLQKMEVDA